MAVVSNHFLGESDQLKGAKGNLTLFPMSYMVNWTIYGSTFALQIGDPWARGGLEPNFD